MSIIKEKKNKQSSKVTLKGIQRMLFRSQLILIVTLAILLGAVGTVINLRYETEKRDRNLQNFAETIARSPITKQEISDDIEGSDVLSEYLNSLKESLSDIDVISIVDKNRMRIYHSTSSLVGTQYEGTMPVFDEESGEYYTTDDVGPSGKQRRAYAAIYDSNGEYVGFVMAIMLMENIKTETMQTLLMFAGITVVAVAIEVIITASLSKKLKRSLLGYEPDVFTSMYKMRDNTLEALKEGIIALDNDGVIQYCNAAALQMLWGDVEKIVVGESIDCAGDAILSNAIRPEGKEFNINISKESIILDRVPIIEDGETVGKVAILHNRAEYKKLMEDLSGTRYLVDSMRANNHDFTNKLHVILGLIQMEMYDEAASYIQNISMVQRENISKVMNAVNDPAVAALLIGKIARASELNVSFVLREGSFYSASDIHLPSEVMVTSIGNLIDNAYDSMNKEAGNDAHNELMFGIYSKPGALLITVDDTGAGIDESDIDHIFDNGYSTKGEGRGTGLYQVKSMIENYGGKITVESQKGVGTSFTVSFSMEK